MKKIDDNISKILDSLLYVISFAITLFLCDVIFNAFEVDSFLYYFISALFLSILNKTIKPVLFKITIPLTGMTFGLFYFVIDVILLEFIDILLGHHFDIYGIYWALFLGIAITIVHFVIEELIIKPLLKGGK